MEDDDGTGAPEPSNLRMRRVQGSQSSDRLVARRGLL